MAEQYVVAGARRIPVGIEVAAREGNLLANVR
jgi:hypothetical protein